MNKYAMEAEIMYTKFTLSGQISSYKNELFLYTYLNENSYSFEFHDWSFWCKISNCWTEMANEINF